MLRKIFLCLLALSVGLAVAANASKVKDLQELVDEGGLVVLSRDYNLNHRSIVIKNSVEIVGNGKTITGGEPAFLIDNADANVTISGVTIKRPIGAGIKIYKCNTAIIYDNDITGVRLAGNKFPTAAGIQISELKGSPWEPIPLDPSEVEDLGDVGTVVVENNMIDIFGDKNPAKVYYSGGIWAIYIMDMDDDNVTTLSFVENTISNPGDSGINLTGTAGVSKTEILGNTVNQRTYKTKELMPTVFCAGIGTYYYFNCSWNPDPDTGDVGFGPAPATIKDNFIYNCPTAGIIADSLQDSLIENNEIHMVDLDTKYCFGVNLCLGGVPNPGKANDPDPEKQIPRTTGNTFANNTIVGTAKLGFRVSENSTDNDFINNDTSGLTVFADPAEGPLPPPNSGYHYSFVPSPFGGSCGNEIIGDAGATINDSHDPICN